MHTIIRTLEQQKYQLLIYFIASDVSTFLPKITDFSENLLSGYTSLKWKTFFSLS